MDTAVSDDEISNCATQELDAAQDALETTYSAALAELDRLASQGDPTARNAQEQLSITQKKWAEFVDSDCDVVFLLNAGGSLRIPTTLKCKADHTMQRVKELQRIFD